MRQAEAPAGPNPTHKRPKAGAGPGLTELQILKDAHRKRRQHQTQLLIELSQALEPPLPKQRKIPAPGYRETGLARFRRTRVVSAK